jgi:hypothetical protein
MAKMRVNPGILARINEIYSGKLEKKRGNPGIQVRKQKINSGELEEKRENPGIQVTKIINEILETKVRKKQKYDKTNSSRSFISAAKVGAGDGGGCAGNRGFDGYIESEYG